MKALRVAFFVAYLLLISPLALAPVLIAVHVLGPLPVLVALGILLALRLWLHLRRRGASAVPSGTEGADRYSSTSGGLL